MSQQVATAIVWLLQVYVGCGVAFALPFVALGVRRIDPIAAQGTWGFRLVIVPGVVALWPYLLLRWIRGGPPPQERNAHRVAAARRRAER